MMRIKLIYADFFSIKRKLFILFIVFAQLEVLAQDSCCISDITYKVHFKNKATCLSIKNKKTLDSVVAILSKCPTQYFTVNSSEVTANSRLNELIWNRMLVSIEYLWSKGVNKERIIFKWHGHEIHYNIITFTLEFTEPSHSPPPQPHIRKTEASKPELK